MAAVQPVVTPAWVVGLFMTVGVLFVPLGTWLKLKYADVVELTQQYEGSGTTVDDCSISEANEGKEVGSLSRHATDTSFFCKHPDISPISATLNMCTVAVLWFMGFACVSRTCNS